MPKPLHSEDPNPRDNSFSTFGLLPEQSANRGAFATSTTIMVVVALLVVLAGFVTPALNPPTRADFTLLAPPPPPPPPPPAVKPPPPPPPPPPVKLPEPPPTPPKVENIPEPVKPAPPPPPAPQPPPRRQNPPPPVVALTPNRRVIANTPLPVVANNTNISRRNTDLTTPAVGPVAINDKKVPASNAPVDLSATKVVTRRTPGNAVGNGPDVGALVTSKKGAGNNANGTEPVAVGVVGGKPGSRGSINNPVTGPVAVVSKVPPPVTPMSATKPTATLAQQAKVLSEPNPNDYITDDAKKNHIAGVIQVKVHVLASGVGQVIGLAGPGLGHGLNEATITIARQMRWRPAMDANGHPIDSDIIVGVRFQSAGVE